ncbi:hypothetical protein Agub_g11706 [Astrephomene gubernaculifera]|uniref:ENTH domain-containing protein n=1 Tax=Astrephomene gubernaculifera TaxID=47775 RepID=A0AAD3DXD8_9CHLO|nr:hypothetical protein Agub_g11706 [Astrephomene gubernaculifera]
MARVIEAVQIFKKVEDVTSPKDDPPPVYLMDELSDMARGSMESSEKIADRIAKRLQHKSPVVKYKALRLTRHIVNKGCHHFQRAMQRHANLVRELIHFKGEADPFKGDTPNQRVRDTAKEAADALFNSVMAQPVNSLGSRIQGFGSSAAPAPPLNTAGSNGGGGGRGGSSAAGPAAGGSRMTGFGSSSYTAPPASSSGPAAGGFAASSQRGVNRPLTGGYGGDASAGNSARGSGGGYGGGGGGGYSAPPVAAAEVLGSEEQLVDGICTPGGLRLAPDAEDLRRFVEAVGSLDGLKVGELLHDKMDGSAPWQQLLRALFAVEAVLLQGATQACGEIAVMFQSDPTPVQAAASHPQAPVRERAARVLKLLLGDAAAATAPVPPPPNAAPAAGPGRGSGTVPAASGAAPQPAVDLLGGLDMLGSPVHAMYGAQPSQQPQATGAGMPAGQPSALSPPLDMGPQYNYGQLPVLQPVLQQNQQQQQQQPPRTAAPRPALDPFDVLQVPTGNNPPAGGSLLQQTMQLQPQMLPQQHQQPVSAQGPYGGYGGLPSGGSAGVQTMGAFPNPSSYGAAPRPAAQAPPPQQQQQPQNGGCAARGAPLDDLFADMNLSGGAPAPGGGAAGGGAMYGMGGGLPYGNNPGPAQGAGSGLMGPSGTAASQAQPQPMFMSGSAVPGMGGIKPAGGSQLDLLGMSAATPQAPSFAPQAYIPGGSSGVGTPTAAGTQYGAAVGGFAGNGGMGTLGMAQQLQQPAKPPAPMHTGDLLGGFGALGSSGAAGVGPGPSGGAAYGAGPGAWQGAPNYSAGAASMGSMAGAGAGMGMMGMGMGPSSSGAGMGLGMGMGGGGGMMVGPGGQVRYEQQGQQSGMQAGMARPGMPGSMPGMAVSGSWQQPMQGAGQRLQPGGAGGLQQQSQQPQHAAFDFLMDQFK